MNDNLEEFLKGEGRVEFYRDKRWKFYYRDCVYFSLYFI